MRTLLVGLALCAVMSGCAAPLNPVGCISFDNSTCTDESGYVNAKNGSDAVNFVIDAAGCAAAIASKDPMGCYGNTSVDWFGANSR